MTNGMFITPKQKKLMKERKRKMKLFQSGVDISKNNKNNNSNNSKVIISQNTSSSPNLSNNNNKKRQRSIDDNNDHDENNISSNNVLENESKESKNINNDKSSKHLKSNNNKKTDMTIVIPSNLSTKEIKKFRKDTRRKVREDGKDENQIIFMDEKTMNDNSNIEPVKKKQKTFTFPCIKQIVELEKLNKENNITNNVVESNNSNHVSNTNTNDTNDNIITNDDDKSKYIAIDCEMVGIGPTSKQSAVARISCVDWDCNVLLDTYVEVPGKVTDFRTWV